MNAQDHKLIAYWANECEQTAEAKRRQQKGDGGKTWARRAEILRGLLQAAQGGTE